MSISGFNLQHIKKAGAIKELQVIAKDHLNQAQSYLNAQSDGCWEYLDERLNKVNHHLDIVKYFISEANKLKESHE